MADPDVRLFGIRHHGPGCARSLLLALDTWRPDCVLVEGPPEADALLPWVADAGLEPPVALLSYCPDSPRRAVYHPFAEFSPEWQALRWATRAGAALRFIDLPRCHDLALANDSDDIADDADAADTDDRAGDAPSDGDAGRTAPTSALSDPLDGLAQAAGWVDGEAWWNHLVEERGQTDDLFAAIEEAMNAARQALPGMAATTGSPHPPATDAREALREAHMRQCLRAARQQGHARIAVVCGAWHVAALRANVTAKADAALLKGLPKVKVQCTWVPWTYRHLTRASGYGAGIQAPGWYLHLWRTAAEPQARGVRWLARVARLMRDRDLDCSAAHLIEALRLADTLSALRQRPAPGLDELHEATRAVLTQGDNAVLASIHDELVVGNRLGQVPAEVPTVPLQRDLEQQQKSYRLKPDATRRTLDLDLRQPNDLARSRLLHRLALLGIDWGRLSGMGVNSRGSFHEVWTVQWQPEFQLALIEASPWGHTVAQAAGARAMARCEQASTLAELAGLVDSALLAELPQAVAAATQTLHDRAALSADVPQLLEALPPLANVYRYGNVRQTDATQVARVLDGLAVRSALALPLVAVALDDDAADTLRQLLLGAHVAVGLRNSADITQAWQRALQLLAELGTAHPLLQGVALRLLLDAGASSADTVAQHLSRHLSTGSEPARAAAWINGFINRNATVLLHDDTVWPLLDDWLSRLSDGHFLHVLPLVRRSFADFGAGERRDLAQRAAQGATAAAAAGPVATSWDDTRAAWPVPRLRQLMGLTP